MLAFVPRYAPVAKLAGLEAEFANSTAANRVEVVEDYPGTGSTDFWVSRSRFPVSTTGLCQTKNWSVN